MAQPPPSPGPQARTRRRKPLNLTRIKSVIVAIVACVTAIGSALTGLGAQVAFAPMLTWMLGFATEKALATALRYGLFAAFAAVIGAFVAHVTPTAFVLRGLILAISATVGAILAAPIGHKPGVVAQRRLFQSIGVVIALFTIVQTSHLSAWDLPHYAAWQSSWRLSLLGFAVGVLTQMMGLASGTLLVPALYFLAGFKARESVALSLLVVALASALPVWSYAKRGLIDPIYGNWAVIGGMFGGFLGGLLLARIPENGVLYLFAVVAMFLCGRELARSA